MFNLFLGVALNCSECSMRNELSRSEMPKIFLRSSLNPPFSPVEMSQLSRLVQGQQVSSGSLFF
jgi:hypothetical protein